MIPIGHAVFSYITPQFESIFMRLIFRVSFASMPHKLARSWFRHSKAAGDHGFYQIWYTGNNPALQQEPQWCLHACTGITISSLKCVLSKNGWMGIDHVQEDTTARLSRLSVHEATR